jgi:hypothetical protein
VKNLNQLNILLLRHSNKTIEPFPPIKDQINAKELYLNACLIELNPNPTGSSTGINDQYKATPKQIAANKNTGQ